MRSIFDLYGKDPRPAVVVGSGESLAGFDFTELASGDYTTIVLNDQMRLADGKYVPDYWIFQDYLVWEQYQHLRIPSETKVLAFHRAIEVAEKKGWSAPWFDQIYRWEGTGRDIHRASTTAISAADFARVLGAPAVALLGMDCSRRYYPDHRKHDSARVKKPHGPFVNAWQVLHRHYAKCGYDFEVMNCSSDTFDVANVQMSWEKWKAYVGATIPDNRDSV